MLLRIVIIFPILLSALLNFWSYQTITGTAFAQSLLSDRQWLAAREMYEEVEDQLMIEERTRLKVQLLYYLNEWASAEQLANAFLRERPQSKMASLVFYFLNKSLLSQNKPLNQNLIMREHASKSLQPKFRSDFLHMLSDEALLKGDLFTAIQYRLEELNNLETAKSVNLEKLENLLKKIQPPEELSILLGNYPNLTWLQDKIFEMKLELLAKLKRHREALKLLDQRLVVARKIGDQEEVEHLEKIQVRFITALNVSPKRIGVILPLSSSSSKVARLAQETLNGDRWEFRRSRRFCVWSGVDKV